MMHVYTTFTDLINYGPRMPVRLTGISATIKLMAQNAPTRFGMIDGLSVYVSDSWSVDLGGGLHYHGLTLDFPVIYFKGEPVPYDQALSVVFDDPADRLYQALLIQRFLVP